MEVSMQREEAKSRILSRDADPALAAARIRHDDTAKA